MILDVLPSLHQLYEGAFGALLIALLSLCFHLTLPTKKTNGYCISLERLEPLGYRLNGFLTNLAVLTIVFVFCQQLPYYYTANYKGLAWASCLLGLAASLYWFRRGRRLLREKRFPDLVPQQRCYTVDKLKQLKNEVLKPKQHDWRYFESQSALQQFYLGFEFNPRITLCGTEVDVKMYYYQFGATMLNVIITCAFLTAKYLSYALIFYVVLLTFFVFEYLYFEKVHLYTYDLFAERIGYKLTWGCIFFYPMFYCIGLWPCYSITGPAGDISLTTGFLIAALYVIGWVFTRGANMQKYYIKTRPCHKNFLIFKQHTLEGSDGRILVSGFWSLSHHVNYLGEVIQAIALALIGFIASGCTNYVPFLYPLYYIGLFIPRAQDDEKICRQKYGEKLWSQYEQKVPYKIIPYVY